MRRQGEEPGFIRIQFVRRVVVTTSIASAATCNTKVNRAALLRAALTERESGDMAGQKIRIRLKSYDHEVIDVSARKIVETVTRAGATVVGPVPLPTEKNVYAVIKSPFKDKDSQEHFEIRTHKRLIDIHQPTPKTVDSLQRLDHLPAGVDIEIRLAFG